MKNIGLRAKVAVFVSCLLVAVIAINAAITIRTERREREEQLVEQGMLFARLTVTDVVRTYGAVGMVPQELSLKMARFFGYYPDLVRLMVISESGLVLYDSDAGPAAARPSVRTEDKGMLERLSLGKPDVRDLFGPDGKRYMDILTTVGDEGPRFIRVRYVISYESLEKRLKDIRADFIIMAAVFIALGIFAAMVFSAKLTGPVMRLKEGAVEIARGNLDLMVEVTGTDEIAELGSSFNRMAVSLKEHRERLERANLDLVRANEEMRQLQDELVRSERMAALGQLAAGLSHEIDNPIGVILGFAEILYEDTPEDDPRREDLYTIIDESRRCKRIVRGLLDFSRPPALGTAPTDVNEVVSNTLDAAVSQRIFRNVEVLTGLDPSVPRMATDPDRLRQVFMNIIINAAQAMPEGGTLKVTSSLEDDGRSVVVSFEDTGGGFAPEDTERIFEPFYTTKRPGVGTGLGLSICRRLLEEQGGRIHADSLPDKGARFTVILPVEGAAGVVLRAGDETETS